MAKGLGKPIRMYVRDRQKLTITSTGKTRRRTSVILGAMTRRIGWLFDLMDEHRESC